MDYRRNFAYINPPKTMTVKPKEYFIELSILDWISLDLGIKSVWKNDIK